MLRCAADGLAKRKLGLMLSTGLRPSATSRPPSGLSRAALDGGGDVYLYLIDDAVDAVDDDSRACARRSRGLKLFVCAYGCQKRRRPLSERATNCGLVVLTDVINGTDRFLALN